MDFIHNTQTFPSHTKNTDIFVQELAPADPTAVKGIIQIVHGMAEHSDRYIAVANYFCSRGYAVFMNDHAGHGKSVKSDDDNGYFADKDGWKCLVDDVYEVTKIARKAYPDKKLIIWGHSMGSFITRSYIAKYKNGADAAVVCGTSGANPGAAAGILIANLICKIKGPKAKSEFINGLAFGSYNKKFKGDTGFEWLSVNEENIRNYLDDPKCGFLFTASGYRDLFCVLSDVSKADWYRAVPKKMPIYLISGTDDPVGNYGKGVKEVYEKLLQTGHDNVAIKLYEGMRHEIHNEDKKDEVWDDIANFADSIVG